MAGELTPKAQEALQEVVLMQGEEIQYCIQADGFFLGSLPIQKLIANFQAFMAKVTGGHIRVFLVLTNMRVLLIQSAAQWCGCTKIKAINTVASNAVIEAGSSKETRLCFVHTRVVHIETRSQRYTLAIKKLKDADLQAFVTHMSQLIIANSSHTH
ncbi:MAG: hypothetical protein R3F65_29215 [bacterium]|nr:hypothetical protein [Myxococcales bacterium]MCB9541446.1 hypothetical protein [Myxococcales bacterium]MCB9552082.1 hypothetical protein [Myxococcales bacterium]